MDVMLVVIAILEAYVIGSVNFAIIFSKLFAKKDIRNYGSGNAGMTNMLRVFGILPGLLTFVCDVLKGVLACYIGKYVIFTYLSAHYSSRWYIPAYGAFLCGIFCMIGHIMPAFFQFKGGKAVATSVGIMLIANWKVIAVGLAVFVIVLLISRIISISSILAAVSVFVVTFFFPVPGGENWVIYLLTGIMCVIVIFKHKDNIKRILKGEEKPIFGNKEKEKQ